MNYSQPQLPVGKAWQRVIREQIAESDQFASYWQQQKIDIRGAIVRPITWKTAKRMVDRYEWLEGPAVGVVACFGIFYGDSLGGVVVYGRDYCENLGRWDRFGYTGKIIYLQRGVCAHWTPTNSASKLIRQSMRQLPEQYEVVTATVDQKAGEIGTIYQAAGFDYVGVIAPPNTTTIVINGVGWSTRWLRKRYGTCSSAKLQEIFGASATIEPIRHEAKARYFGFRGGRLVCRKNRAAIAPFIQPYPRRDEHAPAADAYPYRTLKVQEEFPWG